MTYGLKISSTMDKKLRKVMKKCPSRYEMILSKTKEILQDPNHYKNLRAPLNDWKRVHIDSHFVLVFSIDKADKMVVLEDFDHHDRIYKD